MKFILGKKLEMSQRFGADGSVVPVTLIAAGPCVVTQVKTPEQDGYSAVQVGYGSRRRVSKPSRGHLQGLDPFAALREFRVEDASGFARGQVIRASAFAPGDRVEVEGVSKGHGFQGVVKRHGFAGHPPSHGHKDQERMPGSIGSKRQGPVAPGKRMAGRMGGDQVTVKNLEVVEVDGDRNILAVKGAVPGSRGTLVLLSGPGEMTLEMPQAQQPTANDQKPTVDSKEEAGNSQQETAAVPAASAGETAEQV
jgi:large subunit ribosomal protein L3